MKVNVSNLEQQLVTYTKRINDFQINYRNIYNNYRTLTYYWNDKNSIAFFNKKNQTNYKLDKIYESLEEYKNVYTYLINEYRNIGKIIEWDENGRELILKKIDIIIKYMNKISIKINSLDNVSDSALKSKIAYLKSLNNKNLKYFIGLKENIKKTYKSIEDIEIKAKSKISKINVNYLGNDD